MRVLEDTYWWYQVLRAEVVKDLAVHFPARGFYMLLDAGCGTGGMLQAIRATKPEWTLRGLDVSGTAIQFCQERGLENVTIGSVDDIPFPDATFDALVSLDVLYHAQVSEKHALSEMFRVLKPRGLLVLNLPAFKILRGDHDIAVHGVRRYTVRLVNELLRSTGFRSKTIFYWNAFFFFPLVIWRSLRSFLKVDNGEESKGDLFALPDPVNALLTFVGRIDFTICRSLSLPIGTSVYAIAEKS